MSPGSRFPQALAVVLVEDNSRTARTEPFDTASTQIRCGGSAVRDKPIWTARAGSLRTDQGREVPADSLAGLLGEADCDFKYSQALCPIRWLEPNR